MWKIYNIEFNVKFTVTFGCLLFKQDFIELCKNGNFKSKIEVLHGGFTLL